MITWSKDFETGHAGVDAEHKHLVGLLNELEEAMQKGTGKAKIVATLQGLALYTKNHFQREEDIMRQHACPAWEENKAAHADFLRRMDGWLKQLALSPTTSLVLEVHRQTSEWIKGHILKVDCRLRGCKR